MMRLLAIAALLLVLPVHAQTPTSLRITGAGPTPTILTAQDLAAMPRVSLTASSHGQSGTYEGVTMRDILTRAGVPAGEAVRGPNVAITIHVKGADGYEAGFSLAEFDSAFTDRISILADRRDGKPLDEHGAPFQLILSGEKRPARWVRQVVSIEVRKG